VNTPEELANLQELVRRGYLVVAEMDDDPDCWPGHQVNGYLTFRACHCVQTSTEPLADYLRRFNPQVAVFANHLARLPPPRSYSPGTPVRQFFG
ncbi:hypothetical protein NL533_30275, partial [Klebsiella pneumoniae]|nr:hypothetical protein [Klebsiella pneumoniae]